MQKITTWLPQVITGTIFTGAIAFYLFQFINQVLTLERFNFSWEWLLLFIVASGISFGITLSFKQTRKLHQISIAILPSLAFVTLFLLTNRLCAAPFWNWNAARLAPSFALAKGYQLYYGTNDGAVLNTIYGPISAILFLPVTLLTSFNGAIILAATMGALLTLAPVAYVLLRRPNNRILKLNLFFGFCLYCLADPSLNYSTFAVHVDSSALGFGALAAIFLDRDQFHQSSKNLFLSALFAMLSVWSKQVMLPLLIALPLYLGLSKDFKSLRRYLIYLSVILVATTGLFSLWFGYDNLIFSLWTIPTNHGWINGADSLISKLELGFNTLQELISQSRSLWITGIFLLLIIPTATWRNFSQWCAANPGLIFFLCAIATIPTAIAGRVKIGGDVNAFSFPIYFLLIGCFSMISELIETEKKTRFLSITSLIIIPLVIFTHLPSFTTSKNTFQEVLGLADNPRQKEYLYLRDRPGSIYFPWNPLAGLMAEGKLYHFSYALYDRTLAGFPLTQAHFDRYLPASYAQNQLKVAADPNDYVITKYLKNFTKQVEVPELPGFLVYMPQ
ncbi:MAG: hypothetical protein SFT94_11525 [Pseudanabaenaceae cyanobacterium bins.68]|nr:hypothetical protein [Pseudanabaenaceae cyanobacterium bins.68]